MRLLQNLDFTNCTGWINQIWTNSLSIYLITLSRFDLATLYIAYLPKALTLNKSDFQHVQPSVSGKIKAFTPQNMRVHCAIGASGNLYIIYRNILLGENFKGHFGRGIYFHRESKLFRDVFRKIQNFSKNLNSKIRLLV